MFQVELHVMSATRSLCITFVLLVVASLVGCGDSSSGRRGAQPVNDKEAKRAAALDQLRQDRASTEQAVATPPSDEVGRQMIGAWRLDAKYRDGKWVPWRQAGKSHDVEFRADGTVQAYLHTTKMDGVYSTAPGDGCIDVRMTIGEQPYNYVFSATVEDGMLLMTGWAPAFHKKRFVTSIEDGRAKNSLERFYRVSGFRADE